MEEQAEGVAAKEANTEGRETENELHAGRAAAAEGGEDDAGATRPGDVAALDATVIAESTDNSHRDKTVH